MLEPLLLDELTGNPPVFWAGERMPTAGMEHSCALFDAESDFRLPPSAHGRFCTVYLLEYDLARYKQWPLIVDEALRLFRYGQRGTLFLRFTEGPLLSAFAFAAFLRRRGDFKFELVYQDAFTDGTVVYCLHCARDASRPTLLSFEFALITDGKRPHAAALFAQSVSAIRGIESVEWSIAVCGPAQVGEVQANTAGGPAIRYIDAPESHDSRGWITRKKNLLVGTSLADNLIIAHDRYTMPPEFLEQLFEYGADFDVLVPMQNDSSGERFPDWVTIGSQWTRTGSAILEYGDYSPHGYVNGGLIIGKRRVLSATPWNDLLFWGQYEDVELSRALSEHGITPRLARTVRVNVTATRPGYLQDFERLPFLPDQIALPRFGAVQTEVLVSEFRVGDTYRLDQRSTLRELAAAGIVASNSQWTLAPAGLVFLTRTGSLTVALRARREQSRFLAAFVPAYAGATLMTIEVNRRPLRLRWVECGNGLRCARAMLDDVLDQNASTLTLQFHVDTDAVMLIALAISAQDHDGAIR